MFVRSQWPTTQWYASHATLWDSLTGSMQMYVTTTTNVTSRTTSVTNICANRNHIGQNVATYCKLHKKITCHLKFQIQTVNARRFFQVIRDWKCRLRKLGHDSVCDARMIIDASNIMQQRRQMWNLTNTWMWNTLVCQDRMNKFQTNL